MTTLQKTPDGTYVRTLTSTYIIERVRRPLYDFWQVRNINNGKILACGYTYEEAKNKLMNII